MSQDVATSQETVRYTMDGAVATITLNRPDEMNALDTATKEALLAALQAAARDERVRAVVLTGSGRAFCVGQDLREHLLKLESGEPPLSTVHDHYNPIALAIAQMPKPMIAALNGVAAGAGAAFVRLRPADRVRQGLVHPGVRAGRAVRRLGRVVDAAAAGRHGEGDRAAVQPAADRRAGGVAARPHQ